MVKRGNGFLHLFNSLHVHVRVFLKFFTARTLKLRGVIFDFFNRMADVDFLIPTLYKYMYFVC